MKLLSPTQIKTENVVKRESPLVLPYSQGMIGPQITASKAVRRAIVAPEKRGEPEVKSVEHNRKFTGGIAMVRSEQVVNTGSHFALFLPNHALVMTGIMFQMQLIPQGHLGELWIAGIVVTAAAIPEGTVLGELMILKDPEAAELLTKRMAIDAPFQNGKFPKLELETPTDGQN